MFAISPIYLVDPCQTRRHVEEQGCSTCQITILDQIHSAMQSYQTRYQSNPCQTFLPMCPYLSPLDISEQHNALINPHNLSQQSFFQNPPFPNLLQLHVWQIFLHILFDVGSWRFCQNPLFTWPFFIDALVYANECFIEIFEEEWSGSGFVEGPEIEVTGTIFGEGFGDFSDFEDSSGLELC